jgi:6-pyruvoyltetrahydropterin/6-carboxytetrahydropterin synthase
VLWTSTKTFCHSLGMSAAFRQWKAESHCHFLHGYPLEVSITFSSCALDERGWVIDFGGLKEIKEQYVKLFDHKVLVAADDPELEMYQELSKRKMIDMVVWQEGVSLERFAYRTWDMARLWLAAQDEATKQRVWTSKSKVAEHEGNSATFTPDVPPVRPDEIRTIVQREIRQENLQRRRG